jgi:hypothetical protein
MGTMQHDTETAIFCTACEGQQEVGTTAGGKWLMERQSTPEQRV